MRTIVLMEASANGSALYSAAAISPVPRDTILVPIRRLEGDSGLTPHDRSDAEELMVCRQPSVPLPRLSSLRAVRAEIIGRITDVFRRDREFDVSLPSREDSAPPLKVSVRPTRVRTLELGIDHFS